MSQFIFPISFFVPVFFPLLIPLLVLVPRAEAQTTNLGPGLSTGSSAGSSSGARCLPDKYTTHRIQAQVRHVVDGDTLELTNGERVRIIGINAPEQERKNKRAQPYASESTDYLRTLLREFDNKITLIPGAERTDQYGRSLYHLLLPGNRNLAFEMLARGMAAQSAVTPNTLCAEVYAQAENLARKKPLGLWKKPSFWTVKRSRLPRKVSGFYIITDQVKSVTVVRDNSVSANAEIRNTSWLQLNHGLLVNFRHSPSFTKDDLISDALKGKTIEVRGWIYRFRGKPTLNLHHRANLAIVE